MSEAYDPNLILGYVEDDLPPATRTRFEARLAEDPALAALVRGLRADRRGLRSLPREPSPQIAEDVIQRLERDMLLGEPGRSIGARKEDHHRRMRLGRWLAYGGMAAALLLCVGVLVSSLTGAGLLEEAARYAGVGESFSGKPPGRLAMKPRRSGPAAGGRMQPRTRPSQPQSDAKATSHDRAMARSRGGTKSTASGASAAGAAAGAGAGAAAPDQTAETSVMAQNESAVGGAPAGQTAGGTTQTPPSSRGDAPAEMDAGGLQHPQPETRIAVVPPPLPRPLPEEGGRQTPYPGPFRRKRRGGIFAPREGASVSHSPRSTTRPARRRRAAGRAAGKPPRGQAGARGGGARGVANGGAGASSSPQPPPLLRRPLETARSRPPAELRSDAASLFLESMEHGSIAQQSTARLTARPSSTARPSTNANQAQGQTQATQRLKPPGQAPPAEARLWPFYADAPRPPARAAARRAPFYWNRVLDDQLPPPPGYVTAPRGPASPTTAPEPTF